MFRAFCGDRDTAREEVACLNFSRRMLQDETSSDEHLVAKGVSPHAGDPDRQRLVLDNLSTVRPHDDRATRSEATANHFQRPSTLSGHSTVGAFRHQDRDVTGLDDLPLPTARRQTRHHQNRQPHPRQTSHIPPPSCDRICAQYAAASIHASAVRARRGCNDGEPPRERTVNRLRSRCDARTGSGKYQM